MTELPEDIQKLSNLQMLTLHGNKFTRLPESISQLHKLTFLTLHKNEGLEVPSNWFQFEKFKVLTLPEAQSHDRRIPKDLITVSYDFNALQDLMHAALKPSDKK